MMRGRNRRSGREAGEGETGEECAMDIGKIIREIEVLPDEGPIQLPEDQPSDPEPAQPLPTRSPIPV